MKKFAIILGLFISSTSVAMAQQGDVEAGKQKSQVCASETGGEQGRNNAIMMGQVANLSEQDMKDLAAYFAAQDPAKGDTPEDLIAKGSDLFRRGNPETNIPSCAGCHGPRGNGMGLAAFPDISGQHPAYVISQLENFRSGKRANDPNGMMRGVAAKMTDEEMKLLAEYLHGLY